MDGAAAKREIRDLLWEWDFIGVRGARSAAPDEYDCLLGPLYGRLVDGADADAIGEYLESELPSHFGLQPTPSVDLFVEKLMSWWSGFDARASELDARGHDDPASALEVFERAEDAYWLDGYVASETLPAVAVAGLVAGLDSPSLRVLAGQPSHAGADNTDLWQQVLTELGRVPAPVDPFQRRASRLLEGIVAGRIEACRGAHRAYWLGSEQLDRLETTMEEAPKLIRELVGFIQLADECERHVLTDRDDVRQEIIELARRVLGELRTTPA